MGAADQEAVLMQQSELREYAHTPHFAPLTCREYLSYVQAQCEEHGCEHAPLPRHACVKCMR
jgi:general secretion pathway protein A